MAVTAKFIADFASFHAAVEKADAKLVDFEQNANKVEKSLSRMTDTFSGRKLIQDATLMAEAVDRIGGAAKLTDRELQKVAETARTAALKMQAIGVDVPPKIAALSAQLRTSGTEFQGFLGVVERGGVGLSDLGSIATKVGAAVVGAFTFEAAISGVERLTDATIRGVDAIVRYGTELNALSQQTGVSTTAIQVLAGAMSGFGVNTQELGQAIFQLSRRISGDDASATAALRAMGVSIDDLKNKAPDQVFIDVERALGRLTPGFLQSEAAANLFGSRLGASMISASKDIDAAIAKVREVGTIMDPGAVKAAAAFSDSIDRLEKSLLAAGGNALGPFIQRLTGFVDHVSTAQGRWEQFVKVLVEGPINAASSDLLNLVFGGGQKQAPNFPQPKLAVSHGSDQPPLAVSHGEITKETAELAAMQAQVEGLTKALKPLTEAQQAFLASLFDLGQLKAENLIGTGIDIAQMDAFKKKEDEIIQQQALLATNLRDGAKLYADLQLAGGKATDALNEKTATWLENMERSIQRLRELGQAAGEALTQRGAQAPGGFDQALNRRNSTIDQINSQEQLHPGLTTPSGDDVFATLRAKAFADFDDAIAKLNQGAAAATEGFAQVAGAGGSLSNSLVQFTQTIAGSIPNVNVQTGEGVVGTDPRLLNYLSMGYTMGEALAIVSGAGGALGRPQRRAGGGAVSGGSPYWVGEKGPELFVPSGSGGIVPNGGGGHTINVNVSGMMLSSDPRAREDLKRAVDDAVMAALRRSGQKMGTV